MSEPPHILVVDDDARLRDLLRRFLTDQNFHVSVARDAKEARNQMRLMTFDAIVLDIMMPGESGLSLTESLRKESEDSIPILLLSAKGEAEDRILGFDVGADDYIPKPFEPRELVARLRAILRRGERQAQQEAPMEEPETARHVAFGRFLFDCERNELFENGSLVKLPPVQISLLSQLVASGGEAMSRDALAEGNTMPSTPRSIDVQIARLRRTIEEDPKFPRYLQTVRGIGYVLYSD